MTLLDVNKVDWRDLYTSIRQNLSGKQNDVVEKLSKGEACPVTFPYRDGLATIDLKEAMAKAMSDTASLEIQAKVFVGSGMSEIMVDADELVAAWSEYNSLLSYQQRCLDVISAADTSADVVNGLSALMGSATAAGNSEAVAMIQDLLDVISSMDIDAIQANAASLIPIMCGEFSFTDSSQSAVDLTSFLNSGSYARSALGAFVDSIGITFPDLPAALAKAAQVVFGVGAAAVQAVATGVRKIVKRAYTLFGPAEVFSSTESKQGRYNTTFDANCCCLRYELNELGDLAPESYDSDMAAKVIKKAGRFYDGWSQVHRLSIPGAVIDWVVHKGIGHVHDLFLSFRPVASTMRPTPASGTVSDEMMRQVMNEYEGYYQLPDYLDGASNSDSGRLVRAFGNGQHLFECWYSNYAQVNIPEIWGVPGLNESGQTVANGVSPYPYGIGPVEETPDSYTSRFINDIRGKYGYDVEVNRIPGCRSVFCKRNLESVTSYKAGLVIFKAWRHGLLDSAGLDLAVGSNAQAAYHINTTQDSAEYFQSFATGFAAAVGIIVAIPIAMKLRRKLKLAQIQAVARYNALTFSKDLTPEEASEALSAYKKSRMLGRFVGGLGAAVPAAMDFTPSASSDSWSTPLTTIYTIITGKQPNQPQ